MFKQLLKYSSLTLFFLTGIILILTLGSQIYPNETFLNYPQEPKLQNNLDPLVILLLQVIVIIITSKFTGWLFKKIGQPVVVGEILAGILLGPSFLVSVFPNIDNILFPLESLNSLKLLSQIGIILFMFGVGMKLDLESLRDNTQTAIIVSHISIVIPLFLGIFHSLLIYPYVANSQTSFSAFAMFMGVAMSITAFPVLARIIEEQGLSNSFIGTTAITCASFDDIASWCILAIVISIVEGSGITGAFLTILLTIIFVSVMFFVLKPLLNYILNTDTNNIETNKGQTTVGTLIFILVSSLITIKIGIHELFGAFMAGVVMPTAKDFRSALTDRIETFSNVFLLPLFFVFTGLRTQINLLNNLQSWLICISIIFIASIGKLGGATLASRITGINWRDSLSIGILMNTRGLMELIVVNIGYDLGILSPQVFTMMVFMAITTTFMTGPLLSLVRNLKK